MIATDEIVHRAPLTGDRMVCCGRTVSALIEGGEETVLTTNTRDRVTCPGPPDTAWHVDLGQPEQDQITLRPLTADQIAQARKTRADDAAAQASEEMIARRKAEGLFRLTERARALGTVGSLISQDVLDILGVDWRAG